jgi:hypothetical protein
LELQSLEHAIFHHENEVVKKALVLVMEENVPEAKIWALLQETADGGLSHHIQSNGQRLHKAVQIPFMTLH